MKRLLTAILSLSMLLSLSVQVMATEGTLENFTQVATYEAGTFTDVSTDNTFAENVSAAYELGLMQGKSDTYFGVTESMTRLQTLILACRLHSGYYTPDQTFQMGDYASWEEAVQAYASEYDIYCDMDSLSVAASRSEVAMIFTSALPDEAWIAVNEVEDGSIPDVDMTASYADAVYQLYRAGVLTGNDAVGTFTPDASITRGAMAAVATRAADTTLRKSVTLTVAEEPTVADTVETCAICGTETTCLTVSVYGQDVTIAQDCYNKLQAVAEKYMPYLESQSRSYDSFALVDMNDSGIPELVAEQGVSIVSYSSAMNVAFETYSSYVVMSTYVNAETNEVLMRYGPDGNGNGQYQLFTANAHGGLDDVESGSSFNMDNYDAHLAEILTDMVLVEHSFTIGDEASLLEDLIFFSMAG